MRLDFWIPKDVDPPMWAGWIKGTTKIHLLAYVQGIPKIDPRRIDDRRRLTAIMARHAGITPSQIEEIRIYKRGEQPDEMKRWRD